MPVGWLNFLLDTPSGPPQHLDRGGKAGKSKRRAQAKTARKARARNRGRS